jgi:hypothetical protein
MTAPVGGITIDRSPVDSLGIKSCVTSGTTYAAELLQYP